MWFLSGNTGIVTDIAMCFASSAQWWVGAFRGFVFRVSIWAHFNHYRYNIRYLMCRIYSGSGWSNSLSFAYLALIGRARGLIRKCDNQYGHRLPVRAIPLNMHGCCRAMSILNYLLRGANCPPLLAIRYDQAISHIFDIFYQTTYSRIAYYYRCYGPQHLIHYLTYVVSYCLTSYDYRPIHSPPIDLDPTYVSYEVHIPIRTPTFGTTRSTQQKAEPKGPIKQQLLVICYCCIFVGLTCRLGKDPRGLGFENEIQNMIFHKLVGSFETRALSFEDGHSPFAKGMLHLQTRNIVKLPKTHLSHVWNKQTYGGTEG